MFEKNLSLGTDPQSRSQGGQRPHGLKGLEIEVKFRVDAQDRQRVLESALFATDALLCAEKVRSIYFDTASGDLRKNGIVLRTRKKGRGGIFLCMKSSGGIGQQFVRNEIEVRSPDLQPKLHLLDATTAAQLNRLIEDRPLEAQFETQFDRRARIIEHGRSQLEVTFDDGAITVGGRRTPILEVELELKSGEEPDLYDRAIKLVSELPLRLDFVSKGEKGFRLCGIAPAIPVKAESVQLGRDATRDEAIASIVSNTLTQFTANWAALRESEHPEAIHQMRVALRRMRSALGMFRRVLPCPEFEDLRSEAQRIASAFGPARESDVFLSDAKAGPFSSTDRPKGHDLLLAAVEEHRRNAYNGARALIDARETTLFVLSVQSLIARRTWRSVLSGAESQQLALPAREFARATLAQLYSRARKRGRDLPDVSDEERHKLRITLKKLRYATEFFGSLFERRGRVKSFQARIAELQDLLGAHNDMVTARKFLNELTVEHGPAIDGPSCFILGWHARGLPIADGQLHRSWKALRRADPFWV